MNREIKFRAYSKELGMSEPFTLKETINSDIDEFDVYMQYTGLKDKNAKEIYEGDIQRIIADVLAVVKFDNEKASFVSESIKTGIKSEHLYGAELTETVGNIYENPELLKNT